MEKKLTLSAALSHFHALFKQAIAHISSEMPTDYQIKLRVDV